MTDNGLPDHSVQEAGRYVVVRAKQGEDLLLSIARICERLNLKQGLIVTCIGSLAIARIAGASARSDRKIGYGHASVEELKGPLSVLSCQGTIAQGEDGTTSPHLHGIFLTEDGRAVGGHIFEGSRVLVTMEIGLLETRGEDIRRKVVADTGTPHLEFGNADNLRN